MPHPTPSAPRRRTSRVRAAGGLGVEVLEDRLAPAVVNWDGGPGGTGTTWLTPANWAGDQLPGPADDAVIGAAFAGRTVDVGSTSVRSVTSAAALRVTGTLTASTLTATADVTVVGAVAGSDVRVTGGALVSGGGSLDGVTVHGNIQLSFRATLGLRNGLVLDGTVLSGDYSSLDPGPPPRPRSKPTAARPSRAWALSTYGPSTTTSCGGTTARRSGWPTPAPP